MFESVTANYTDQKPVRTKKFTAAVFVNAQRTYAEYAGSTVFVFIQNPTYTGSKGITPAPEKLKRAMFRMSSKGIANVL